MEVILLQKVANLGNIGDRVKVRSGYGRNFLLPQGKATLATADHIARFEARRVELERLAREQLVSAEDRAAAMKDFKLTIAAKAGTEGKLFGSIGTSDIAEACSRTGFNVQRSGDSGTTWTTLNANPVVATTFTDFTAVSGMAYQYRVIAVDAVTSSAFSAVVSTSAFPTAPGVTMDQLLREQTFAAAPARVGGSVPPELVAQLNRELQAWECTYNTVRPHQALGYLTPQEFLAQSSPPRKELEFH